MRGGIRRKTPDELLREVEAEEARVARGRLKIFLGYASGVGKSFRMLDEARRRRERGQDVVVGAIQAVVPPEVTEVLSRLEVLPMKTAGDTQVMDVEAILARRPGVCVIDGLAYDNPTRWLDVKRLLEAGVSVIASINIQYIAELGLRERPTVPIDFIKSADEIVIVDAPTAESTERAARLSSLRELALVVAADVVDHQLETYLEEHGIKQNFGTIERILVCITPRANIDDMLETGRAIAEKFHGELIVAYVNQPQTTPEDQAALDAKLAKARAAGAKIEILDGVDPVETLLAFARSRGVTQLFIGHTQRSGMWSRWWGTPVDKLIRCSEGIDIRVFPQQV